MRFTERALQVINNLKESQGEVSILLDDTGCCGFSNVFLRKGLPGRDFAEADSIKGARVFFHQKFLSGLNGQMIYIDFLENAGDDSFSLETGYGGRLVMTAKLH